MSLAYVRTYSNPETDTCLFTHYVLKTGAHIKSVSGIGSRRKVITRQAPSWGRRDKVVKLQIFSK